MDRFSFGTILRRRAKYESATSHRLEVHMGEKAVFQYIYAKCMAGLAFGEVNKESER